MMVNTWVPRGVPGSDTTGGVFAAVLVLEPQPILETSAIEKMAASRVSGDRRRGNRKKNSIAKALPPTIRPRTFWLVVVLGAVVISVSVVVPPPLTLAGVKLHVVSLFGGGVQPKPTVPLKPLN